MSKTISLAEIQAKVKAPKGQYNSFGKYKFRSAEDILEAAKPIVNQMGFAIMIKDKMVNLGDRYYVEATVFLTNGSEEYYCTAYAREEESKKGMDAAQVTGAASSYARKYALNGLFALDDTKDADATNTHGKEQITLETFKPEMVRECNNRDELNDLFIKYKAQLSAADVMIFSQRKIELS